jgi:4-amino-4-deoxy-L-arabinose transferase-like glycosyltransferase
MRFDSSRWLILIVLIALSARLSVLPWAIDRAPRLDEKQYLSVGPSIVFLGVPRYSNPLWDEAHSSPGYPHLMAACHALFGIDGYRLGVMLVQCILGALTAAFVYWIALMLFGRRAAILSGWIAALYPTFVAYPHYIFSETSYTFIMTGTTALLLYLSSKPKALALLGAGLLAGLAALTRSAFLLQTPFVISWIALRDFALDKRRFALAAAFALGVALVIAPWAARNTARYDRFLLIDTNAGNVLYKNWNAIPPENHDIGLLDRWPRDSNHYRGYPPMRSRVQTENIVDRNNAEIRAALAFTLRYPMIFIRNSAYRTLEAMNPTSFLVRALRNSEYGSTPSIVEEAIVLAVIGSTMALMIFGLLGLLMARITYESFLPILLILTHAGICATIVSTSRYRYPMMALLIPFAAYALLEWRRFPRFAEARLRWLAVGVVAIPMLVAWFIYTPLSFPPVANS